MDMSHLSCKKKLKVLNDDSFILPLEEISQKGEKMRPISHKKKTHLGKSCVTMKDLMVKFYEKYELSDVVCGELSRSSGKTSESKSKTKHSVLKLSMQLRIFLQRSEYSFERGEFCKNKTKISLPGPIFHVFSRYRI